jgi:hypothetical protein
MTDAVDSRQVEVEILRRRLQAASSRQEAALWQTRLDAELKLRSATKAQFEQVWGRGDAFLGWLRL